jgi:hypothetical protein
MPSRNLAALLTLALAACAGGTGQVDAALADAGDGGTVIIPTSDAGGADVFYRLSISATPIYVNDVPTSSEKPVSGNILVQRNYQNVTDAVVTLNGTNVPYSSGGLYDVGGAGVTGLGPGSQLTIVATTSNPSDSHTLTLTCPTAIDFSSPAANSVTGDGQKLAVAWSPGIPYTAMRIVGGPLLGMFACFTKDSGDEVSYEGHGADFLDLTVGQTTQDFTVKGDCRRYLLELQYPGKTIQVLDSGGSDFGYCTVQHRIWLKGP